MSTVVVNRSLKTLHEALSLNSAAVQDAVVTADYVYRGLEGDLFATQGGSGGPLWKALSPEYKKRKDRMFEGATRTVKGIAKARGNRLAGFAVAAVLGAENKILQLKGDMKRAFANAGGEHAARGFILPQGARIQLGAQGPEYYRFHAEGVGKLPKRDQQQRKEDQDKAIVAGVRRALVPHIVRSIRVALQAGAPRGSGA